MAVVERVTFVGRLKCREVVFTGISTVVVKLNSLANGFTLSILLGNSNVY